VTTKGEMQLLWANGMGIPELLDLHAHELAEKIRAALPERWCRCNGMCGDCWGRDQALAAADLIDPEVDGE
jgi:hypothetical protein